MHSQERRWFLPLIALVGALMMLFYGFYYIERLAYLNGVYATLTSIARFNTSIAASEGITNLATQSTATAFGLYITYILLPFGLMAFTISALLLFSRLYARINWIILILTSVIFAMIATILNATFSIGDYRPIFILPYFSSLLVLIPGVYSLKVSRSEEKQTRATPIAIDPRTPYSNMIMLSNRFMAKLKGNIRILDMHFDSKALENLARLLQSHKESYRSFMVLSKKDRLGREFSIEYWDFIEELKKNGIEFELRVVPEELTIEQHERFILDDNIAYKIPPLNIINKKSEHIVSINHDEALNRFNYLWSKSTKFENIKH
ncbi:MAG: hypothetical protein ACP5TL_02705 [Candidatus Micrarchaeia archaeon]